MRLVLGTNVVVSALLSGGKPARLFEAAVHGDIELVTSPELIEELRDVLSRQHLAAGAARTSSFGDAIALYSRLAIIATPLQVLRVCPPIPMMTMSMPVHWQAAPNSS